MKTSDSTNLTQGSHTTRVASNTFGLLRHGQTVWNTEKRIQGFGDSPLTEKGREQTGKWLKTLREYSWERIIASDLGRVQETVSILNKELQLPVIYDARLREQCWGQWEGLSLPGIEKNHKEELARRVAMGWHFSAPGGETRLEVKDRVLTTLTEAAAKWPGQNILVVCHRGVIKAILYHITGRAFLPDEDPLLQQNCLHLISHAGGTFSPVALNIAQTEEP